MGIFPDGKDKNLVWENCEKNFPRTKWRSIMIKFKQITAAIMAVATIATTTISASAENVAKEWKAVYQSGAPSSVNKIYVYDDIPVYGNGYKVDCTYFLRVYDSLVIVTPPTGSTFRFTGTGTYERVIPYKPSVLYR